MWRAVDERLERSVAVKQIPIQPTLPESERAVIHQRAVREARNAARFHHPNAIVVYDITEHEGHPCLVMEYFGSHSLAAVLSQRTALPAEEVARIGEQVADALVTAHEAGIVHRDIKPGNVLLNEHGVAKITDFGISRAVGDITLTATGLVSGTAAYLPPEVARGAEPSPASDVFSLGATLFHALEGEPPYGLNQNSLALLYAAANAQMRAPSTAGPLSEVLRELLNPEPAARPSMRAAHAALQRLSRPGVSVAATSVLPAQQRERRGQAVTHAVTHAPAAPQTRTVPRRAAASEPPAPHGERTRPFAYAALVAAVLMAVVAGVIFLTNLPADEDPDGPGLPSETIAADAGQTPSSGTQVDWGQAGQLVQQFYSDPSGSWSLLTPAAQQVYGSQQEFNEYWSSRVIMSFGLIEAHKRANNDDGSVDMRVNGLNYDGQTKHADLRVVSSDGRLLIDGDTR